MHTLLILASILVVGRTALALTPAGRPGFHEARELPFTIATSWLLGLFVLSLSLAAARLLRIESPALPVLALPWLLIALARWRLGPAAMVPRHEPHRGPISPATWTLLAATCGLLAFAAIQASDPSLRPVWVPPPDKVVASMVLTALAVEGLRTMRRPAWPGLVAGLLVFVNATGDAPFLGFNQTIGGIEILSGGGAAFALASWRLADRRAMTLSVLSFAGLPLLQLTAPIELQATELLPMFIGLAILCALQPEASRPRLFKMSAVAALLSTVIFLFARPQQWVESITSSPYPALVPFAVLLPIAFALGIRRREPEFIGLFLLVSAFAVYGQTCGSFRQAIGVLPLCIALGSSRARGGNEPSA